MSEPIKLDVFGAMMRVLIRHLGLERVLELAKEVGAQEAEAEAIRAMMQDGAPVKSK